VRPREGEKKKNSLFPGEREGEKYKRKEKTYTT
jgi:hypothetical protein